MTSASATIRFVNSVLLWERKGEGKGDILNPVRHGICALGFPRNWHGFCALADDLN
jgi:hypothetical protein